MYKRQGLSNVTDESTLTDIQNTESDAAFTQDGEKLVWKLDRFARNRYDAVNYK